MGGEGPWVERGDGCSAGGQVKGVSGATSVLMMSFRGPQVDR